MIEQDKLIHFTVGLLSGLVALVSPVLALALGQALGAGKEVYDYKYGGDVDFNDYTATVAGNALVVLVVSVL